MRRHTLWVVVLFLALAGAAVADTLVVTRVPLWYNGISTGILEGKWNGNDVFLVCDDWDHTTYLNHPFEVNVSRFDSLEHVRFYREDLNQLMYYQQAAWLLSQLWEADTNADRIALQYALWAVFNPTHNFPTELPPLTADRLMQAQDPDNYERPYPNILIFTDGPNQEFMTMVPEPSTWWLFTLGVVLLVASRVLAVRRQRLHMPCYPARTNNRNRPISKGSPTGL